MITMMTIYYNDDDDDDSNYDRDDDDDDDNDDNVNCYYINYQVSLTYGLKITIATLRLL